MSKEIKYGSDAQSLIESGINQVADIVKTTVGPKGRNVLIREQLNVPIITNDGVTIAKNIKLKDNIEDAGAALVISAANKTNEVAGDGTTTTTILTQALIRNYHDEVEDRNTSEVNPVQIQKEMIEAGNKINDYLLSSAIPTDNEDSMKRVATISSGDEKIGNLIGDAFQQAGEFGTVIVEDNMTNSKDYVDSVQGMKFSNGMITPYLLNDRSTMKTTYKDCKIVVTTEQLDNIIALMPIIDMSIKNNMRVLLLCQDMSTECLNSIIMNKAQGIPLNIAVVRLPGYGQLREELVDDICLATGATLITRDQGKTINEVTIEDLGELKEVTVTQDDTILKFNDTIIKNNEEIDLLKLRQDRAELLKQRLEECKDNEATSIKRRISNLISGISAIRVSGNSEVELKDKKLRIEDAINSVESAREEGIVAGGGYSFISAYMKLGDELEKTIGGKIVKNSLIEPTRQIAENAGKYGIDIVNECIEKQLGYNANTDEFEELIDSGVINSVKTDRYSLINAISVASTIITMGGLVIEENQKDPNTLVLPDNFGSSMIAKM